MDKYREQAETVKAAILKMAEHPETLENFCSYLSYHFAGWMEKWANDPEGMAAEFEYFAGMYD